MTEGAAEDVGDDILDLVRLVYDQLGMKRDQFEVRKEVIDQEMMVDDQDILLARIPVMPVVETIAVKGALHGIAVVGIAAYLRPEFRDERQFVFISRLCICRPFTKCLVCFSKFRKLPLAFQTEIIVLPFEQSVCKLLRQGLLHKDEVFVHKLVLQGDRGRRYNGLLLREYRRDEIGKGFADSGSRLHKESLLPFQTR